MSANRYEIWNAMQSGHFPDDFGNLVSAYHTEWEWLYVGCNPIGMTPESFTNLYLPRDYFMRGYVAAKITPQYRYVGA